MERLKTIIIRIVGLVWILQWANFASADPDTLWTKTYGWGVAFDAHQTPDGGFALIHPFGEDFHLIKTDGQGDTLWTRRYGTLEYEMPSAMELTSDSGYIMAGSGGPIWAPTYLVRVNSLGDTIWTRQYGNEEVLDRAMCIREINNNGFVMAGWSGNLFEYHMFWMKLDSNGDSIWCRRLETEPRDYAGSIRQTQDGGYILAGSSQGAGCLIKTDEYGEIVWLRYTGGDLEDVWPTNDGGYIGVGNVTQEWLSTKMIYLVRADSLGNLMWSKLFGETGEDKWNLGYAVQQTSDGGYVLAGEMGPWAQTDLYIVKTDVSGNMEWDRRYSGGSGEDRAYSIEETKRDGVLDGGYIAAGRHAGGGAWLLRLGEDTAVDEGHSDLPYNPTSIRAYPNPFNSECRIVFNGRKSTVVSLTIHNLLGQKVASLVDGKMDAGYHTVTWDGANYSSGIYFYTLTAGDRVLTRKMVLVK